MNPKRAYSKHKLNAQLRDIPFTLTFDEWWALWEPWWAQRGTGPNDMQMCRTRDEGGYTPGNVRIDTQRANAAEHGVAVRVRRSAYAASSMQPSTRSPSANEGAKWIWRNPFAPYTEDDEENA